MLVGGSRPSHLCSVSCHYVLWGSAKTWTPRIYSSSSYTRDFKTHTRAREHREEEQPHVLPNGAKFSGCKRSAAAPTDAAEPPLLPHHVTALLFTPATGIQETGKKNTTWPTVSLQGTLPVITATKRKKRLWAVLLTCFSEYKMWRLEPSSSWEELRIIFHS